MCEGRAGRPAVQTHRSQGGRGSLRAGRTGLPYSRFCRKGHIANIFGSSHSTLPVWPESSHSPHVNSVWLCSSKTLFAQTGQVEVGSWRRTAGKGSRPRGFQPAKSPHLGPTQPESIRPSGRGAEHRCSSPGGYNAPSEWRTTGPIQPHILHTREPEPRESRQVVQALAVGRNRGLPQGGTVALGSDCLPRAGQPSAHDSPRLSGLGRRCLLSVSVLSDCPLLRTGGPALLRLRGPVLGTLRARWKNRALSLPSLGGRL